MTWPASDGQVLNGRSIRPHINYCIFDLEGTLFWSEEFKNHNYRQAIYCLTQIQALTIEKAELRLSSKREELCHTLGYTPALSSTLCALGVSLNEWANYQSVLSPEVVLHDSELVAYLCELRTKYQLILYTNMCHSLTQAVLDRLGLTTVLHHFVSAQALGHTKPSKQGVQTLIDKYLIQPYRTVAFGDRYFLDVKPITDIGGWGYVVTSREELFASFDLLLESGRHP